MVQYGTSHLKAFLQSRPPIRNPSPVVTGPQDVGVRVGGTLNGSRPLGSKDLNNRVLGPKYYNISWYLGPKTRFFGFLDP